MGGEKSGFGKGNGGTIAGSKEGRPVFLKKI
jgi:hypothetical protein